MSSAHALLARQQRGLSLVELLVGLTLGLTVIAAALALYLSSGHAYRSTQATTQMTEDASVALAILRAQIALAGYGNPTGLDSQGQITRVFTGPGLFGCTGSITPTSIGHPQLQDIACNDDPEQPDALVVRYEADPRNTLATAAGTPTDCLGNSTPLVDGTHHLADNRYFVHGHTLSCRGNGHSVSQPLVDHIVDLDLRYGIATPAASDPDALTLRYLTAQEVSGTATPPSASPLWRQVKAVHLCLVLRSELEVQDSVMSYTDCQGLTQTAPDRRLYRAFHTTVSLPNPL
ncbi:MAG: PilW family protein [Aquabacterium sp.]|uniref:PilW family protein n=1 Tax=Aquabacterium sp. TaxID=1872578 RepID=UPI002A369222|nr:PilW family protein [Aquabacterium sp.]MDX9842862.1 PilW family protein [Aquabacterium sp.]